MSIFRNFYQSIISFGNSLQSPLLLLLRLYWGYHFFISGRGKITHIEPTADYFASLNIPFPELNAYVSGGIECFGGLLLLVGLASRLAAIPLASTMLVALFTAHWIAVRNLFSEPSQFVSQPPFNYLLTALIVLAFGPGMYSLDYLLGRWVFKSKK